MKVPALLVAAFAATSVWSHGTPPTDAEIIEHTERNEKARACSPRGPPSPGKIAIDNVRVFDGYNVLPPSSVYLEGGFISGPGGNITQHIDGEGGVLVPGLIDSHCHPMTADDLVTLTSYGVTTAFVMACYAPPLCRSLMGHPGLVDIHNVSAPAAAPGSEHGNLTTAVNATAAKTILVAGQDDIPRWFETQLGGWNPDRIKVIAESPGLSQAELNQITAMSHAAGKEVVGHAGTLAAQQQVVAAGVDHVHHMPCDIPAPEELAQQILANGQISVPTLTIMKGIAGSPLCPNGNYNASAQTALLYYNTGIPLLVGTDANRQVLVIGFGKSAHTELGLLVQAGIPPAAVLRAATSLPSRIWGLNDRGIIAPGFRADLILIDGDPTVNITNMRNMKRVWAAGIEFTGPLGTF